MAACTAATIAVLLLTGPALDGWVETAEESRGTPKWKHARWSDEAWMVATARGELVVEARTRPRHVIEYAVPGGRLVGWNLGEWGGSLEWHPDEGDASTVLECNVTGILEADGTVHALCGLAHLSLTEGAIHRLARLGSGRWVPARSVGIPVAPTRWGNPNAHQAIHAATGHPDGGLILVTSDGLWRFHRGGASELMGAPNYWSSLYPSSVTVVGRRVFVGSRHHVTAFDLDDPSESSWLVPEGCSCVTATEDD